MMLFDTHSHLHFEQYDEDRPETLERARESGVRELLCVGIDLDDSKRALEFSKSNEGVYATAGVHPNDITSVNADVLKEIEALLQEKNIVALGEIGLDFFREHTPYALQEEVLCQFFDIYKRHNKPLVIHCRDAYDRFWEMCRSELNGPIRGVMHCFSSHKEDMKRFVDLGFHISFAGPLTYKKNDELREACKACPLDRVLIETDAPYLPPQSKRGKRNESSLMVETAQMGAELHGLSIEEFGQKTTQNARDLFLPEGS